TFLSFSFQHILLLERLFLAYYSWNFHLPFSNLKGIITGKTEYTCIIFYAKHFYLDTFIFLYSYDTKHLIIRLINVQIYDKLDRNFVIDVLSLKIEMKNN